MRPLRYYIFIFIVFEIVIGSYFYTLYNNKVNRYHQQVIARVDAALKSAINTFELANDHFHSYQSATLAQFIMQTNNASVQERDAIRTQLLQKYSNFYNTKKLNSMDVLHLFDAKGNSLLRFHEIHKYDDPVIKLRYSLQQLNKKFYYQKGLEIGVFKESFRFQYPLFYDGNFVGAYEYGIGFDTLIEEMEKFYGTRHLFILKSKDIDAIVNPDVITSRYQKVFIDSKSFYFKKRTKHNDIDYERFEYVTHLEKFKKALLLHEPSAIEGYRDGEFFTIAIKPISDIQTKEVGYLFSYIQNSPRPSFIKTLIIEVALSFLLALGAYFYLIKQLRHKIYIRNLINLQHNMLIVTDGKNIKDANDSLLKFFGYNNLNAFHKNHNCICDFFLQGEGYLQKRMGKETWLSYMKIHPKKKHHVKMKEHKNIRIFELYREDFKDSKNVVVTFRDITNEIKEHEALEDRANFDTLTHIYNRNRFDYFLDKEIERSNRYGETFSLIMFDIDHFKQVNDSYGHDIGDSVLQELSELIATHTRDVDIFARWGGEEFMIISHTDIAKAEAFAEKLRKVVDEYTFTHINTITCSFGVSQYHTNDTNEMITKRCDEMLYAAKNSGRNCVVSLR